MPTIPPDQLEIFCTNLRSYVLRQSMAESGGVARLFTPPYDAERQASQKAEKAIRAAIAGNAELLDKFKQLKLCIEIHHDSAKMFDHIREDAYREYCALRAELAEA